MGGSKKAQIKKDSKYKISHGIETATVRCRVCNQPNPVFEATFVPHLEKKVDVFFKYFEDIRPQDQVNLIRSGGHCSLR